ncbi:LLM class flavin-dependent oxidoreductase [Janibacter sp. HTCC2649]|uniref:LLM class flavin-dependent oxidoreductase n=1 Tax=Janibacter sp. HTCC2649 TaxID=313589 RepID=UPI00059311DA|nr:LLM class flavin-dependent oxidoreductase [Janibacter sp. HTCC2649]
MRIPDPALVLLVGASGSGKSTWAATHYRVTEVVSSDALRAVVGSGTADLDASDDAFSLLDQVVAGRTWRGLTVVIDTLGLDPDRRAGWAAMARKAGFATVAVVLDTPAATCRARNARRDRSVPANVLNAQLQRVREVQSELEAEGWVVHVVSGDEPGWNVASMAGSVTGSDVGSREASVAAPARSTATPGEPRVMLQVSRFPWGEDPLAWLREVALAADEAGFAGIALMDHLIQIPQVGRAWDPIPEPWVTLGALAGLGTDLELGTLCTPATFRTAGIIAKSAATLDVLTGGRAFCGLGAGWWEREHAAFGLPFPGAAGRLDGLETAAETVRALWAPGTKAYAGERVSLPETTCYPRPVGKLPLIIGGGGEQRTLRIAARWGDACNLQGDLDTVRHKTAVLHRHCDHVGRPRDEVGVTVLDIAIVGSDRDDTWVRVERLRGRTKAAAFAARHHAAEVEAHRERHDRLFDEGVGTVFLALPDFEGAADMERIAALARR